MTNVFGMFLSSLLSLFAALMTIAAFVINLIFYQHAENSIGDVSISTGLLLAPPSVVPLHNYFF